MLKVTVVVNENIPNQLELFLKTFKEQNSSDNIEYTYVITSTGFIRTYEGCEHRLIKPFNNDIRFGFVHILDELIAQKPDLIIIASDQIVCRRSISPLLQYLSVVENWEICGSAGSPGYFPMSALLSDPPAYIPLDTYMHINFRFCILNPKKLFTDNADYAQSIVMDDQYDFIDELTFNLRYTKKFVNQLICCQSTSYLLDFDRIYNYVVDIYYDHGVDDNWYFLDECYEIAEGDLRHDIKPFLKKRIPKSITAAMSKQRLLEQHVTVMYTDVSDIVGEEI